MQQQEAPPPPPEEYLFKVLILGDVGTGKTSIIKRFVHGVFSNNYKATIGVDFALKVIEQPAQKRVVRLQLWDIAGQERFGSMTRVYYREAAAAIVVFDQTREVTLEGAMRWKRDVDAKLGTETPVVLFSNKSDMSETKPDLDAYCKQGGFVGWIETSAKNGQGVEAGFNLLLSHIPALKGPDVLPQQQQDTELVRLAAATGRGESASIKQKTGCC